MATAASKKRASRRDGSVATDDRASRRSLALVQAKALGLIGGEKNARIAGRVSQVLLDAAMKKAGVISPTALLEYALTVLALQENFGDKIFAHEGAVPQDLDIEF
ncbi:MAG: hypothetical protein JWL84_2278 [Rhodospirillales bacterium]|jgi:hypothetical protein|nr:hypothetical protein [Rhodospirillales bacterium]